VLLIDQPRQVLEARIDQHSAGALVRGQREQHLHAAGVSHSSLGADRHRSFKRHPAAWGASDPSQQPLVTRPVEARSRREQSADAPTAARSGHDHGRGGISITREKAHAPIILDRASQTRLSTSLRRAR